MIGDLLWPGYLPAYRAVADLERQEDVRGDVESVASEGWGRGRDAARRRLPDIAAVARSQRDLRAIHRSTKNHAAMDRGEDRLIRCEGADPDLRHRWPVLQRQHRAAA